MKITRTDAHDRFSFYQRQDFDISACCQDLIDQRPFGDHAFYIFAHARTLGLDEKFKLFANGKFPSFDKVPEKTIIWQPRLTKPKSQTNSMLFKAYPGTDNIKIIWIIPPREMWEQYAKGKMTENETVWNSIHEFQHNREQLESREEDDLSDDAIDRIYNEISRNAKRENGKFKPV